MANLKSRNETLKINDIDIIRFTCQIYNLLSQFWLLYNTSNLKLKQIIIFKKVSLESLLISQLFPRNGPLFSPREEVVCALSSTTEKVEYAWFREQPDKSSLTYEHMWDAPFGHYKGRVFLNALMLTLVIFDSIKYQTKLMEGYEWPDIT